MRTVFVALLGLGLWIPGAHSQRLVFMPVMHDVPLVLDQPRMLVNSKLVTITRFRFYAGHFELFHGGRAVHRHDAYHLIDAADPKTLSLDLGLTSAETIDSVVFTLGVDSLTNVSGAMAGDLDPIKGMYWTWNSGYINLKLEGTSPGSPYASRAFELHLGGYMPPFATAQRVVLPVSGSGPWAISVDVERLLQVADVTSKCNVMSPGKTAVRLSRTAASMFSHRFLPPEDDVFKR